MDDIVGANRERERLEAIGDWYLSEELDIDRTLIDFRYRTLHPHLRGNSCLELGSAEGVMTRMLASRFERLTVVEGAPQLAASIPSLPGTNVVCSLFEDFSPGELYDSIVMEHVLEHVSDPHALLVRAKSWLEPDGRLFVGVPNGDSLHRLAAVKMGLLPTATSLNERDEAVGHRRVYTVASLESELRLAGLTIDICEGVFLKVLSNAQINSTWTPEMIAAFYELGKDFPTLCAEILAVAKVA